jgi:hypothetical protein
VHGMVSGRGTQLMLGARSPLLGALSTGSEVGGVGAGV